MIKRRKLVAAAASVLAAPALAQKPATMRFAPEGDVAVLDPIWTTATVTRAETQRVFFENPSYLPLGASYEATALRKLRGVRIGFPQFYDVRPD